MSRLLPVAFALVSLSLAGCGGDDGAPSTKEFASEAEQICRDAQEELEQIAESMETPEDAADALDDAIDESRRLVGEVADLERPEGDAGDTAQEFVEGFREDLNDKLVPALEELKRAIQDKDPQGLQEAVARLQALEANVSDRPARELGANACVG